MAKYGWTWANETWNSTWFSPFDMYRILGAKVSRSFIKSGFARRMDADAVFDVEGEIDVFVEYIMQMMMARKSSETCITKCLAFRAYAIKPLVHEMPKLMMPVCYQYGEYDWVSRAPADQLLSEGKVKGSCHSTPKSGHHLYAQAGFDCVRNMIAFTHDEAEATAFAESRK
jgi:hypothetical protein